MSLDEIIDAGRQARKPGLIARAMALKGNTALSAVEHAAIKQQLENDIGALRRLPHK